jgi:hypothetical protein
MNGLQTTEMLDYKKKMLFNLSFKSFKGCNKQANNINKIFSCR